MTFVLVLAILVIIILAVLIIGGKGYAGFA
jgi:hypothetical protein